MRKRAKLRKRSMSSPLIQDIDRQILISHKEERLHDENVAVNKIKSDPTYFFQFTKRSSK